MIVASFLEVNTLNGHGQPNLASISLKDKPLGFYMIGS